MKRSLILFALLTSCLHNSLYAQLTVTQSEEVSFVLTKGAKCKSYSFDGRAYFLLNTEKSFGESSNSLVNDGYDLLKVSADGRFLDDMTFKYDLGAFKSMNKINTVGCVGNTAFILMENMDKETGKNTLFMSTLSENGNIGSEKKNIGFIPYSKMINPGDWLTYITPDRKHIAIVSVYPPEKGEPQKGNYYFLDENFTVLSSGELNIPSTSDKKKYYSFSLYASDKGDMYLVTYIDPVVYRKAAAEKSFTMFEVLLKPPYTAARDFAGTITASGSLVLGGYTKEKKTFSFGEAQTKAVWFYNSDNPTVAIIHEFEKPTALMKAFGIVVNNNTAFLVGEQITETREPKSAGDAPFQENYSYDYNDIVISGYNLSDDSKFDIVLSRKIRGRNMTLDLIPSFGIVNGKFCLIYNDDLKKYVKDAMSYKVPVMVTITAEGLMEQPVHFEKAFDTGNTSFNLFTGFSVFADNQVTVISSNGSKVKTAVFK